jgi:hypothetical protein
MRLLIRRTDLEVFRDGVPLGYGLAWREPHRAVAVFAPVPLNLVISVLRAVWWWLRTANLDGPLERMWDRGYDRGFQAGVQVGEWRRDQDLQAREVRGHAQGVSDTIAALRQAFDDKH